MTCQNPSGNGCSLEDCYTNLFALADLSGIKWRRVRNESATLYARPLEDPILSTYIKCIQAEILCAWAKVQYSYGDVPKATNQLGYKRELWIFWYGDEPANLDSLLPKELVEVESGSWDGGMSYECRTFIFKALHNRIERCMLSKKYVRLGKWFVLPHENYSDASLQLSVSFHNFSLHGDSTVCASVDVERHQPVLVVTEQHVQLARSSPQGIPVILSPYNLAGRLIGQSLYYEQDAAAKTLLQEWQEFYPFARGSWGAESTMAHSAELANSGLPPLLDVIVAGVHMRYPATYVVIPKDPSLPGPAGADNVALDLPLEDCTSSSLHGTGSRVPQHKPGFSATRPWSLVPSTDSVVQKTFEESCVLSSRKLSSAATSVGCGNNHQDDEENQWSLCDPSAKHSCLCGRQVATCATKLTMHGTNGSRGAVNRLTCKNLLPVSSKHTKVERESSVSQSVTSFKKLSFHRRLQKCGTPSAAGERPPTFSAYSNHRRKAKDSASPLSAVPSPACAGGPQSIPAAERIMPTLSPQNPSRDVANPVVTESQSLRLTHPISNQYGTANAATPQPTTDASSQAAGVQGLFSKTTREYASFPSTVINQNASERFKRPQLPAHPALDCNGALDNEDLSTPSLYDFNLSDDWLDYPIKKLKLHSELSASGSLVMQRKAIPCSMVCLISSFPGKGAVNGYMGSQQTLGDGSVRSSCEAEQRLAPVPVPADTITAVCSSPLDESKPARTVMLPSSPLMLPFGTGLKSVKALQPKLSDLDNIFDADEEMDTSLSPDGAQNCEGILNEYGKGSSLMSAVVNGTIGASELCQMFPTPPSLEGCSALSPSGCHDNPVTTDMHCHTQSIHYYETSPGIAASTVFPKSDDKQDSPTRIVRTPQFSKYVTCAKYAPIDLPSHRLPSSSLPTTPLWQNVVDSKIAKTHLPSSFSSKSAMVETLQPVAATSQSMSLLSHDNSLFSFVSPSPSAVSNSSHLLSLDNQSPAPLSIPRKSCVNSAPADVSTLCTTRNSNLLPEANSLIVNVMLSDSLLNIFKDASFDSCNICICNTNIKGTDVGLYLPDPVKEAQYRCTCGFSAAVNRANGYCSGLFYEDEVDIIGLRDERFDDHRPPLDPGPLSLVDGATLTDASAVHSETSNSMMLVEHCAITYSTSFLVAQKIPSARPTAPHMLAVSSPNAEKMLNAYRSDIGATVLAALDAGRVAAGGMPVDSSQVSASKTACLANWPLPAVPASSLLSTSKDCQLPKCARSADVMVALKGLQHILQEACHKKRMTRLWDSSYVVNGPLTWKDFHKMAWRGNEEACKPQPIPSILVGYDKDWVSCSPFVLKYWENLLLRPYGQPHNMAYVVLAPDCSTPGSGGGLLSAIQTFFRELSTTYETCQLGRHSPLDRSQHMRDGIIQVGKKIASRPTQAQAADADGQRSSSSGAAAGSYTAWINSLGDDAVSRKLKLYAQVFQFVLAPLLAQQPIDKSLFESSATLKAMAAPAANAASTSAPRTSAAGGAFVPPPASLTPTHVASSSAYCLPLPVPDPMDERGDAATGNFSDNPLKESEETSSDDSSSDDVGLTIYIVEDITFAACSKLSSLCGSNSKSHWLSHGQKPDDDDDDDDDHNAVTVGVYGLLRCYHQFLSCLPETIRPRLQLQIVPLSMVVHMFGGGGDGISSCSDCSQLNLVKGLCFSVYAQCQHAMTHLPTGRALTSFGPLVSSTPGASVANSKIFLTPYVLAPQKDVQARLSSGYAAEGTCGGGVLLCAYCLSEDQRWLLASVTDESGELHCTKAINIAITNRSRRRRSFAVHRHGLQKLFDFLLDTIGRTCMPWRIVIGRLGRLGHEELKVWATLLNHKCLVRANAKMRGELCKPCSFVPAPADTPTIVSACLTSLEPHKSFKILTDAVRRPATLKDKHHTAAAATSSSSSVLAGGSATAANGGGGALGARLLSTPEDVSCTHILVIPNSTTAGGSQSHHDAPLDLPPDLTDDVEIFNFREDDLDIFFGLGESPGHTSMDSPVGRDSMGDANSAMAGIGGNLTNGVGLMRGVSTGGCNNGARSTNASAPGTAGGNSDGSDEASPNLLQQPLAMGYYLSTAPAGVLPHWFWAACPQEEDACPTSLKFALHFHSFLQQQHQDELVGSTSASSQNKSVPLHPLDSSSTCDVLRFVLETYDKLSWLTIDACTNDRQSCLPLHINHLVQLSHAVATVAAAINSS